MPNKPRSDSKLDALTPQQKEMLRDWLVEDNMSYADAKERLYQDFNVRTSVGALSRFYATQCFSLRSSEAKSFAEEFGSLMTETDPAFDKATLALVKKRAFEVAAARDGDLDALSILAKIIGDSAKLESKKRDQQLAERRIVILEKRAAQADAAEKVTRDETLTPAQRAAKLKEIFGLK